MRPPRPLAQDLSTTFGRMHPFPFLFDASLNLINSIIKKTVAKYNYSELLESARCANLTY